MFSKVIWCALSFENIWLYVRLIFFYVFGENYLFHKKNQILGDLTALYIQWLTYKFCFSWIFIDDSY